MAKIRFARVVACLMAVIVPLSMVSAETNTAMIYTSGRVLVNGAGVARTTAIFSGDKLQVPVESAATINAKGSSVTVAPGSSVTYQGDAISLEGRSAVSISTTEGMAARVMKLTIAPAAKAQTKFQVVRLNGNILIAANTGAVVVSDDSAKPTTVSEGKTAVVPDPAPQNLPPATRTAGGTSFGGPVTNGEAAIIGLAAAGAAVGAAYLTTQSKTPVTPVHP